MVLQLIEATVFQPDQDIARDIEVKVSRASSADILPLITPERVATSIIFFRSVEKSVHLILQSLTMLVSPSR